MKRLFFALALLLMPLLIFAGVQDESGFDYSQLVVALTAVVTYVAAFIGNKLKAGNAVILAIIIPATGALASWLLTLVTDDSSWLLGFGLSLISTFLYELQRQLTQGNRR